GPSTAGTATTRSRTPSRACATTRCSSRRSSSASRSRRRRAPTSRAGSTSGGLLDEREREQQRALLGAEVVVGHEVEQRLSRRARAAGDALEVVDRERRLQLGQHLARELRALVQVARGHAGDGGAGEDAAGGGGGV